MITILDELKLELHPHAAAFCQTFLPAGHRSGNYWIIGNARGVPGRSMWVHLSGERQGYWTDAAGEYGGRGDLIHILRVQLRSLTKAMRRAREFVRAREANDLSYDHEYSEAELTKVGEGCRGGLPDPCYQARIVGKSASEVHQRWEQCHPIRDRDIVDRYLRWRGILFRPRGNLIRVTPWKDGIAMATPIYAQSGHGDLIGIMTTELKPFTKKRRVFGRARGGGVVFAPGSASIRQPKDTLVIAEGIETGLSYAQLYPDSQVVVTYGVENGRALFVPSEVRRLVVASDNDPAGDRMYDAIVARYEKRLMAARARPSHNDFNDVLISTMSCP